MILRDDIPGHTKQTEHAALCHETGRLVIGCDVILSGEITACKDLIVQGQLQAELKEASYLEVTETGLFSGNATVESAQISGHFEGYLKVTGQLIIHATAVINGTIEYGTVEICPGANVNAALKQCAHSHEAADHDEHIAALDPIAAQNPGAVSESDMQSIITRIEQSDAMDNGSSDHARDALFQHAANS